MTNSTVEDNRKKLRGIFQLNFRDQAIFFLDHFVNIQNDIEASEIVYKLHQKCIQYCQGNKDDNSSINELNAHIALESIGKPVTQTEFRTYAQNIDSNLKSDIPFMILLLFNFDAHWETIITTKVGNGLEVEKSKDALKEAQVKLDKAVQAEKKASKEAQEADQAMDKAQEEESSLLDAISIRKVQEEELKLAKVQADEALVQVHRQNDDIRKKREDLERIINDEGNGIVARNKAKAELRIMESDDPLPLRKAKINNENALKKVRKRTESCIRAINLSEEAKKNAEMAQEEARLIKERALELEKQAEVNKKQAQEAINELKKILDELSTGNLIPWGSLYYIDREMKEAERFLPQKKIKEYKQKLSEEKTKKVHDVKSSGA